MAPPSRVPSQASSPVGGSKRGLKPPALIPDSNLDSIEAQDTNVIPPLTVRERDDTSRETACVRIGTVMGGDPENEDDFVT